MGRDKKREKDYKQKNRQAEKEKKPAMGLKNYSLIYGEINFIKL